MPVTLSSTRSRASESVYLQKWLLESARLHRTETRHTLNAPEECKVNFADACQPQLRTRESITLCIGTFKGSQVNLPRRVLSSITVDIKIWRKCQSNILLGNPEKPLWVEEEYVADGDKYRTPLQSVDTATRRALGMTPSKLRVAFIHPDLGIGGAERLVVDAALGLQSLGHTVDIYTSHHDPNHCFDETRNGTLRVHHVVPPFPRAWHGKFHILFAHARQLHLTLTQFILRSDPPEYDVFFVDQLSTCVPLLRMLSGKRVLFYCHFPDKLLAHGAFVEGTFQKNKVGLLKTLYRYPMDWLEEVTTRQADTIVANSKFTARITMTHLTSIKSAPKVVYPGINTKAYQASVDWSAPDIVQIASQRPTLISLNRFEMKKNAALAIGAFALLRKKPSLQQSSRNMRLVLAGGYDPRLEDNIRTLGSLVDHARSSKLSFKCITPLQSKTAAPSFTGKTSTEPDVLFLLNFTTSQRSALLQSSSTLALLYTPANEHFGIGPVEGMICGLPVLACDSGGPTESIIDQPPEQRTGWLRTPDAGIWADALEEICLMDDSERASLAQRSKHRAESVFGMETMAKELEGLLAQTAGMGAVETWRVKGAAFILAFLVGLVLAVLSRHS